MSGTSLDGIDTALVELQDDTITLVASHLREFDTTIQQQLRQLCSHPTIKLSQLGTLDVSLGRLYADSTNALLQAEQIKPQNIIAIGCHGQTIWHQPSSSQPFTLQIGDPNTLAANTGITTVADFRRKDIALGGQGAPLAPAFHAALCPIDPRDQWVLNIGGIANLSLIPHSHHHRPQGFDCGPGNLLMDMHCQQHRQQPFDHQGQWAQQGEVDPRLLTTLLADPYFTAPPPKSTGREYFNRQWLQQCLSPHPTITTADTQRTLLELTAQTIADEIARIPNNAQHLWVCGGGAHNTFLINRLSDLSNMSVQTTDALGIGPDWIEACCFAWLARQTLQQQTCCVSQVTGAKRDAILGGIWQVKRNHETL